MHCSLLPVIMIASACHAGCSAVDQVAAETVTLPGQFFGCYGAAEEGLCYAAGPQRFFLTIGTCTDGQFPKAMMISRHRSDAPGSWTQEAINAVSYPGSGGMCHVGDLDAGTNYLFAPVSNFDRNQTAAPTVHLVRFDFALDYSIHWPLTFDAGEMDSLSDLAGIAVTPEYLYAVQYQEPGVLDPAIYRFPLDGSEAIDPSGRVRFPIATPFANGIEIRDGAAYITWGDTVTSSEPWGFIDVYDLSTLDPLTVATPQQCIQYDVSYNACFGVPNSHAQGLTFQGSNLWVVADAGKQIRLLDDPPLLCPGDADGDGSVDFGDLNLVLENWGAAGGSGDVNGDGAVNFDDLNLVLNRWGSIC
ncbi:MAG: hypothetical protein KDA21_09060 [Phycisphaerales bacterium]|nr:hypothetical protein [Phycisphaerales bacterium]